MSKQELEERLDAVRKRNLELEEQLRKGRMVETDIELALAGQ